MEQTLREAAITMGVKEARAKVAEYVRAVRERHHSEDVAILRGYRALAKGHTVIDLPQVIGLGGVFESGLPRLAVATSSHSFVWVQRTVSGRVEFLPRRRWDMRPRMTKDCYRLPAATLPSVETHPWRANDPWDGDHRAMVPHIPPALRPAHSLDGYTTLFEVDVWAKDPTAPKDPALLKHIGGDLYAVLATWDLSPLEQSVLNGRVRCMHAEPAEVFRFDQPGQRGYGHDFTFMPTDKDGLAAKVVGWTTPRPERGDVLVLPGPNGGGSCYVISDITWTIDPRDMWVATTRYDRDAVKADGSTDLVRPRRSFAQIVKDRQAVEMGDAKQAWKDARDASL